MRLIPRLRNRYFLLPKRCRSSLSVSLCQCLCCCTFVSAQCVLFICRIMFHQYLGVRFFLSKSAQIGVMAALGVHKQRNGRLKVKDRIVLLSWLQLPPPQRPDFNFVPGSRLPTSSRICRLASKRTLNIKGAMRSPNVIPVSRTS